MDPFLQFLTWQFILFCLLVLGITQFIRNVVEFSFKDSATTKVWTKLILPTTPLLIGSLLGFLLRGPFPEGINIKDSQVVFGFVAGLLSGTLYRVIKSILKSKLGDNAEENEDLLTSIRETINNAPAVSDGTAIITTTTTTVPVVDGQPVGAIPQATVLVPVTELTTNSKE